MFFDLIAPETARFRLFDAGVACVSDPELPWRGETRPGPPESRKQVTPAGAIVTLLADALNAYDGLVAEASQSASSSWHADPGERNRLREDALRELELIREGIAGARRVIPTLARALSSETGASELRGTSRAVLAVVARALGYFEEVLESTAALEQFVADGTSASSDISSRSVRDDRVQRDTTPGTTAQQLQLIRVLRPRLRTIAG